MQELNLKVLAYVTKVYNSGGSRVIVVPKKIRHILGLVTGDLVQISITKIGINENDKELIISEAKETMERQKLGEE